MSNQKNSVRAAQARKSVRGKKKKHNRGLTAMIALLCVAVVGLIAMIIFTQPRNRDVQAMNVSVVTPVPVTPTPVVTATPEPTEAPTPTPVPQTTEAPVTASELLGFGKPLDETNDSAVQTAEGVVQGSEGFAYLPVYKKAATTEKRIAITVDDCFQVDNLRTIISCAYKNGGKLTIFPIGENISLQGMAETLQTAVFKLGYEIENHTWSHARIFRLSEQEMAEEIWKQGQALNQALGVNYEEHFFRLMGGDGNNDQRTHNYLRQLGFKGIAEWSLSGSDADLKWIEDALSPGMIYLFHTTDRDTGILQQFIPYAVSQGYELVTMNELLGFDDNEISEFSPSQMPEPASYETDYHTHAEGDYAWIIVQMQEQLRDLGFLTLDGPATGYYGKQTTAAIKAYQESVGLPATGEADAATQKSLVG